jgi:dTDP-4-amino-4,6-dideoxygalactose transaminase
LKTGLRPILADINLTDIGFSTEDLHRKITTNTSAVIVVHLLGYPANPDEVDESCKPQDIFIVEDAAQAFGNTTSDLPERKLGLSCDAGFFSFGRGKPLTVMHGGILVTNSEEIYRRAIKIYQNHQDGLEKTIAFFKKELENSTKEGIN